MTFDDVVSTTEILQRFFISQRLSDYIDRDRAIELNMIAYNALSEVRKASFELEALMTDESHQAQQ